MLSFPRTWVLTDVLSDSVSNSTVLVYELGMTRVSAGWDIPATKFSATGTTNGEP
jgi:hypothetical protein